VPEVFREEWNSDFHFIYSSSPDRGLHHLLKLWPQIQDLVMGHFQTECHLHVCYGVENFVKHSRWSHREDANRALTIESKLDQPGVIYHGKIGQDALAALMLNCDLMLYPADTMSPTETGCISIVEALAAGCPVVTTDCDCIGPDYHEVTVQVPLPWDERRFLEAIIDALDPEDYQQRVEVGREFALTRDWPVIAAQWATTLHHHTNKEIA
jgi:glycosyltransferase involved in cell wall biosynthesis